MLLILTLWTSCKPRIIGIQEYRQYYPIVKVYSFLGGRLGAQTEDNLTGYQQFIPSKMICQFPIRWMEVEATKGTYVWPSQLDQNAQICNGHIKIIGTRTTPQWARLWSSYMGSPPKTQHYDEYANFIIATCQRYNLKAIEIWNEPDCRPSEAGSNMYWFGAWVGNSETHYQGGQRYGTFLKTIYPWIKSGCPNVKIIGGALIGNSTSLDFINGVMSVSGAKFDAVSFHQYLLVGSSFDLPFNFANQLSPLVNAPLILSETSVRGTEGDTLKQYQANYLTYLLRQQGWSNIQTIMWYTLEHYWENTQLIRNGQATPAWYVFSGALQ